jgi:hypothetical protein
MHPYRLMGIAFLFAGLSLPVRAASNRESITTAQIADAIRAAGVRVYAGQVSLLSDVIARTNSPALAVESVGPWEGNLARVRMTCVSSEECLPFFVTIRRSRTDVSDDVFDASDFRALRHSPAEPPKSKVILRSGSPAVLLLDGGHVHIRLAVICLENGAVGQTIRVTGRAHEHTYMAEVCSDGSLRGTL